MHVNRHRGDMEVEIVIEKNMVRSPDTQDPINM
jgi:hypothetical protein